MNIKKWLAGHYYTEFLLFLLPKNSDLYSLALTEGISQYSQRSDNSRFKICLLYLFLPPPKFVICVEDITLQPWAEKEERTA